MDPTMKSHPTTTLALAAAVATAAGCAAPAPGPTSGRLAPPARAPEARAGFAPSESRTNERLYAETSALALAHPNRIQLRALRQSPGDRPIEMLTLAEDVGIADRQPSILVLAGMDGHRWATTEVALAMVHALAREWPAGLRGVTVNVVPRGNPDAAAQFMAGPRRAYSGNSIEHDNDGDGRSEEDPPVDMNGDGLITQMRVEREAPPWGAPGWNPDPRDPRLAVRAPKDEPARWCIWTEGYDADADARIAEDWPGGVDPERNFPFAWPKEEDESGATALIAPEAAWLAGLARGNPRMFAALVLGRHDTVVQLPDGNSQASADAPALNDPADAEVFGRLAAAFREISGQRAAAGESLRGSFAAWLIAQRGIPAFATTLWSCPGAAPGSAGTDPEWLAYSDSSRGGRGFVPWTRQPHPQLFEVEVGGWVPGFRENPPAEALPALAESYVRFLETVGRSRPAIRVDEPTAESVRPGVWKFRVSLTNTGALPTIMRGARSERVDSTHVARIDGAGLRFPGGRKVLLVPGLDPGEAVDLTWIVEAPPNALVEVVVLHGGERIASFPFVDGKRTGGR
jgi:hypothetical protein